MMKTDKIREHHMSPSILAKKLQYAAYVLCYLLVFSLPAMAESSSSRGLRLGLPLVGFEVYNYSNDDGLSSSYLRYSILPAIVPTTATGVVGFDFGGPEVGGMLQASGFHIDFESWYQLEGARHTWALGPYFQYHFRSGRLVQPMLGLTSIVGLEFEDFEYDENERHKYSEVTFSLGVAGGLRLALAERLSMDFDMVFSYGRGDRNETITSLNGSYTDGAHEINFFRSAGMCVTLSGWLKGGVMSP